MNFWDQVVNRTLRYRGRKAIVGHALNHRSLMRFECQDQQPTAILRHAAPSIP